jgi:hypothetical protein
VGQGVDSGADPKPLSETSKQDLGEAIAKWGLLSMSKTAPRWK